MKAVPCIWRWLLYSHTNDISLSLSPGPAQELPQDAHSCNATRLTQQTLHKHVSKVAQHGKEALTPDRTHMGLWGRGKGSQCDPMSMGSYQGAI